MKKKKQDLKCLIIGCGSIGERHLYNLKKIGLKNIALCDNDKKRAKKLALKYNTNEFYDLDSALSFQPDFSLICTYSDSHIKVASTCINAESHIFIEKPIASNIMGVENMLRKANSKNLKVAVGYNLRFDPGLNLLRKKILSNTISVPLSIFSEWGQSIKLWKSGTNYKNHYILRKGGGIILDDSHEYDYMRWLIRDEVKSIYCKTIKMKSIKTETESIASIIMKFKKGMIGTLIMDYVRPNYERKCHIIGEKGDLKWQYILKKGSGKNYETKAISKVTTSLTDQNTNEKNNFNVRVNEMYVKEMEDFITSIMKDKKPTVDGWEGLKTLKIGIAALQSAKQDKIVFL